MSENEQPKRNDRLYWIGAGVIVAAGLAAFVLPRLLRPCPCREHQAALAHPEADAAKVAQASAERSYDVPRVEVPEEARNGNS